VNDPDFSDVIGGSTGPSGRPLAVTAEQLHAITGRVAPGGTAEEINDVVCESKICTNLELAHFIGQFAYECAYFWRYDETVVPGQYEGRISLGNTQPGDGFNFRGRGACQLTGRANYTAFRDWLRAVGAAGLGFEPVDVLTMPEIVSQPPYRWLAAAFFWATHPALRNAANRDDVAGCTSIITGAYRPGEAQGLSARQRMTTRAIEVLG
jgi:putative chitinase